jgi:adenylate cyclase
MSGDDLFAAEEDVIALGAQLIADGSFGSVEDKRRYQQLLKEYQKLFRTTRRLVRLSDHNELRINATAEVIARKNKELGAPLPNCRNIYRSKFTTRSLLVRKM